MTSRDFTSSKEVVPSTKKYKSDSKEVNQDKVPSSLVTHHPKKSSGKGPFQTLGLSEAVCKALGKTGFKLPTPIQRKAIPAILRGCDCVAMARTGSGKTAAFVLPLVSKLDGHSETVGVRAVILSPTRELAMQTAKVTRSFMKFTDLRLTLLVGGQSLETQFDKLANNPDILIATPGRLLHHIKEAGLSLERVSWLVFDEADRLFELGLADQLHDVLSHCPTTRQALLFSATLPTKLVEFARVGLQNAEYIKLDAEHTLSDSLQMHSLMVRTDAKPAALLKVLTDLGVAQQEGACHVADVVENEDEEAEEVVIEQKSTKSKTKTLVFVATRHHVDFFSALLNKQGISAAGVYGSMDQHCRTAALQRFRSGKCAVLVVTDVAARGIDIPLLDFVVNYDFPPSPKLFIHRAGRTARNGQSGRCVSLLTADDLPYVIELFLFLGKKLQLGGLGENVVGFAGLGEWEESVRLMVSEDVGLETAKMSMQLAYGPYFKTRPSAGKESVKRSKHLVQELGGLGAVLARGSGFNGQTTGVSTDRSPADITTASDYLKQLRTFRPSMSESAISSVTNEKFTKSVLAPKLLRSEIRAVVVGKRKIAETESTASDSADEAAIEDSASDSASDNEDIKQVKPAKPVKPSTPSRPVKPATKVSSVVKPAQSGISVFDQTTYRSSFYLGAAKTGEEKSSVFDLAGLDIVPDDSQDMRKSQTVKKWDNKRKKYVLMQLGPDGRPLKQNRVINEAGRRLSGKDSKAADGELFAKWSKATRKRIQAPGELEKAPKGGQDRVVDFDDESDLDSAKPAKPVKSGKPGNSSNAPFHGTVPTQFLTNKQKRKEKQAGFREEGRVTSRGDEKKATNLKQIDQIAKQRVSMKTKKIMQNPKARKEFSKKSKEAFFAKQNARIAQPNRNSRSRVVGGGGGRGGRGGRR